MGAKAGTSAAVVLGEDGEPCASLQNVTSHAAAFQNPSVPVQSSPLFPKQSQYQNEIIYFQPRPLFFFFLLSMT